jgi:hypothetical protein
MSVSTRSRNPSQRRCRAMSRALRSEIASSTTPLVSDGHLEFANSGRNVSVG